MKVEEMKLSDLKPYEKNPRKNDKAVEPVANSIKEFGFRVPLVIDKDNVIVTGHTRYKAAKKLGLKTVPCIKADDLSDEQIKAFRLADNKVGEISEWDTELLDLECEELLANSDIDLELFGFTDPTADEDESDDEYEPINDEGYGGTQQMENKLHCGKITTLLTEDEYKDFLDRYNKYVNEAGCSFGFIRSLLNG